MRLRQVLKRGKRFILYNTMTTIDSHKKTDHINIRKFDKIESGRMSVETIFQNHKYLDWDHTPKNINLNSIKEKIVRKKSILSSINRSSMNDTNVLPSFEVSKVDIQQRIISIIVFALIITGITLTFLATVNANEVPKEQGIVMY